MGIARLSAALSLCVLSICAVPSFAAPFDGAPEELAPPAEIAPVMVQTQLPAPVPPSEVGRYQLLQAEYGTAAVNGEQTLERHLLRLDTVTGTVWVARQVQTVDRKSGKVIQQRYWEPFEQYLTSRQPR